MHTSDIVEVVVKKIKRAEGLNIVPFIDIMLVLLAIVLSISTFIAQGQIKINVPQANSAPAKQTQKIEILIDSKNQIYFDNQPISLEELKKRLSQISPKDLVVLRSDRESRFESFVKVLEILQEKSHENFAIGTQRD